MSFYHYSRQYSHARTEADRIRILEAWEAAESAEQVDDDNYELIRDYLSDRDADRLAGGYVHDFLDRGSNY